MLFGSDDDGAPSVSLDFLGPLLRPLLAPIRRLLHHRQIAAALAQYRQRTGGAADQAAQFAESGSFQSQVLRLFSLGSAAETAELERIASSAIASCHSTKYYRPADLLSDVVDALSSHTFLGASPDGEPPLGELVDQARREKLALVIRAWLVPIKIAEVESLLASYARTIGRALPFAALGRFERQAARVFASLEQNEAPYLRDELLAFLNDWKQRAGLRSRYREPALAVEELRGYLDGQRHLEDAPGLRMRRQGLAVRLSTVAPESRQALLAAALDRIRSDPAAAPGSKPDGPVAAAGAPAAAAAVAAAPPPMRASPQPTQTAATAPAPAGEPDAKQDGLLAIQLSCPKCGGGFTADDEVVSLECEYCGSLLLLTASDRDEIYLEAAKLQAGEEILETFYAHRVAAQHAELAARYRDAEGNPTVSQLAIQAELKQFEKSLRAATRLQEAHPIRVPYRHVSAKIVQGALGQWSGGGKRVRVRAFEVEHTVPAYALGSTSFRDQGLRMGRAKVSPLRVAEMQALGASFVPAVPTPEAQYPEVQKWCRRTLEREIDPVAKHGETLFQRRCLVYRTYWLARLAVGGASEWLLLDGSNGNLAGQPYPREAEQMLGARIADPLRSNEESFRAVQVVAPRCPDCGFEQHPDRRFSFVVCPNCHRGLRLEAGGLKLTSYAHAPAAHDGASEFVPFWRYSFSVELAGGARASDLGEYRTALFGDTRGDGRAAASAPRGATLYIPAFRLLGTEPGDQAWKAVLEWIHANPPEVRPEKIPLGGTLKAWGASLRESEARALGPFALMGLHDATTGARMTAAHVKRGVSGATLRLDTPELLMVPLRRDGDDLLLPETGARLPSLLLRGGQQLDALRATVHGLSDRL
jgi:predicted RNA-binding Zn-ribbon protein involved in translation (DUF1610 family)